MPSTASLTLNTLKFSELFATLKDYISHPPRTRCLGILGAPGTGKTDGVEAAAELMGKPLSYVNAPLITPGDLLGAAFPSPDRQWTDFLPSRLLMEDSVLFIDELPNSNHATMNAMNRVLLNGELYGRRFREARIWAGNPSTTSSVAEILPEILINKSTIFVVDYQYSDLLDFALNAGSGRLHPVVAAFIAETRNRYLQVKAYTPYQLEGVATPAPGDPFPSPRSYENLSDDLRRVEARRVPFDVYRAAYATIGAEAGGAFGDFYTVAEYLPSVQRILAGSNPRFPEAAFVDGKVITTLQIMCLYSILAAVQDEAELSSSCRWVFHNVKIGLFGQELLRTFTTVLMNSRFKDKFTTVCCEVGMTIFGKDQYQKFVSDLIRQDVEVGAF